MRVRYWSCSKFADWLRGTKKINSGTGTEWDEWKKTSKSKFPFRHWLAEEGLDKIQNFINAPYDALQSATYWFNNRFIEQTHLCRTGLKKGQWHETDDRMLYGLFGELVWFVSEQKSWMGYISGSLEDDNDCTCELCQYEKKQRDDIRAKRNGREL